MFEEEGATRFLSIIHNAGRDIKEPAQNVVVSPVEP
jgi:hypothetical protein